MVWARLGGHSTELSHRVMARSDRDDGGPPLVLVSTAGRRVMMGGGRLLLRCGELQGPQR